ncbi:hypothetical protein DSO57_1003066 [Entomophthora muscae]|uniref:Uncharacterized protein n=1 Tax=Entomophthora muscae TaxID=34485 RepID=A0ACC2TJH1_9FUNG|nr:hypothetical protein DSO57_1003066 [Entomophthora muscae]
MALLFDCKCYGEDQDTLMENYSLVHSRYHELPTLQRWLMRSLATSIKLCVLCVIPVAIFTIFFLFGVKDWCLIEYTLLAWSLCEIGFYIKWKKNLQAPFERKPYAVDLTLRVALASHILSHVEDVEEMLACWMLERPVGQLRLDYFQDWIGWMFFDKRAKDMDAKEMAQAEEIHRLFEARLPQKKDSHQPIENCRVMVPTTDPMVCQPKPFVFHLGIQLVQQFAFWKLRGLGFQRNSLHGMFYWFLPGNSPEPPIMYIHGIGIGFFMYLPTLTTLSQTHIGRGVVLLELPHISMAPFDVILDHDQTLEAIDAIFHRHSIEKVSLVAHSFGTLVASWINRHRSQYLSQLVLVDPVCFRIWDPALAHNFLYAEPFSFLHELARFFVAQDPLVTHTLSKEVYWYESVMYPEEIAIPATIFLASRDWVVDAAGIERYLTQRLPSDCQVVVMDAVHAACLTQMPLVSKVVAAM